MIRPLSSLIVLFIAATCSFSGPNKENEAEFFAGVTLLQQKTDLKPEEKAEKFRELAVLTGISAVEAKTVLERYREKPEEWKKIDSIMMKLLNDANRGFQKNDSLQTAAKDSRKKADSIRQSLNAKKTNVALKDKGLKNTAKPLTASKTKR